jgi:hypothetical protein
MFHWFGVVQSTRGDALPNWQVGLVEIDTQNIVPIYADENSTPIQSVSGIANRALADDNGNYDFYVPSGTYTLRFFDSSGVFQREIRFVAMYGTDFTTGLIDDLASTEPGKGAGLIGFLQSGTGAVARTVQDKLRETVSVFDFLTASEIQDVVTKTGSVDISAKIQAAIDSLQNAGGGTLIFPNGVYYIGTGLNVGNGTSVAPDNTKAPVSLEGVGPVSGVGYASPSNCAIIKSNVAGPAIKFNGTLGWGLKRFAFTFTTSSTAAQAYAVYNGKSGRAEDITVLNCPGLLHILYHSWGTVNVEFNQAENIYIFMGVNSPANAVALKLDALPGGSADPAHNLFTNLTVQPDKASHVGLELAYCDTNVFINYRFKPLVGFLPAVAVRFNYTSHTANFFPNNNQFIGGSNYVSTIESVGTPTHPAQVSNRWSGFELGNNSPVPTALGFAVDKMALSRNTTFYINQSASGVGLFGPGDTTSFGIYQGRPCKTLQQAYDQLARYFDLNGYTATFDIADGSYTAGVDAQTPTQGGRSIFKGQGGGTVFLGAATPFIARGDTDIEVQSVNLGPSSGHSALGDGGTIRIGNGTVFSGVTASHIAADNGGKALLVANYFIVGGASAHFEARHGSSISGAVTVTLLGNVTITNFAVAREASSLRAVGSTFTLGAFAVTGNRYSATLNGVIDTNGGGASFFPGTAGGATATGGQYA